MKKMLVFTRFNDVITMEEREGWTPCALAEFDENGIEKAVYLQGDSVVAYATMLRGVLSKNGTEDFRTYVLRGDEIVAVDG